MTPLRGEPLHVFIAAQPTLALLRRHGVQLMEAIDEVLLLLLRQGVESLLTAKRVFLTGKGLALMALEPGAEMGAAHVSRRRAEWTPRQSVWASRCTGIRDAGTVHRARNRRAVGRDAGVGRGTRSISGRDPTAIRRSVIRLVSVRWSAEWLMGGLGDMRRLRLRLAAMSSMLLRVGKGERGGSGERE